MKPGVQHTLIVLSLVLIAGLTIWPLPLHLNNSIATVSEYSSSLCDSDPAMFCWNLWWTAGWIRGEHSLLDCHMLHHPFGLSLRHHTLSCANGVVAFPVTMLLGVIPALNLLLIFHALLTSVATYLLARTLSVKPWPAVLTALVFTWWPARLIHSAFHLNLASTGWMVLTLFFLHKAVKKKHLLYTIAAIVSGALTGACSLHLFIGLFMLMPVVLLPFTESSDHISNKISRVFIVALACVVLLLPLMLPLLQHNPDIPDRLESEKQKYSIQPVYHVIPPCSSAVFGDISSEWYKSTPGNVIENTGYLGLIVILLAVSSWFFGNRSDRWLLGYCLAFIILSWGPCLITSAGNIPMPYRLLEKLPGLASGRTPGRFLIQAGLLLSLVSGRQIQRFWSMHHKWTLILVLLTGIELLPKNLDLIPVDINLPNIQGPVLEVPNLWSDRSLMLAQVYHGQPITTGFTARIPETVFQRISGIPMLSELSSASNLSYSAFEALQLPEFRSDLIRLKKLLNIETIRSDRGDILDLTSLSNDMLDPEIYFLDRWSGPEDWGNGLNRVYWGIWPESRLRVIGIETMDSITFQCNLLAARQLGNQVVTVSVMSDDKVITTMDIDVNQGWVPVTVTIPIEHDLRSETDSSTKPYRDIWFTFSSGTAPMDLPDSSPVDSSRADSRLLSVAISKLKIMSQNATR